MGEFEYQTSVIHLPARLNEFTDEAESAEQLSTAGTPTEITDIVLNVKVKCNYEEIDKFITELLWPHESMVINNRWLSVFQLYTLHSLNDPVDMSSLTERKLYRPKLFIRKNDKFSPFYFHFLLNLFDIEYQLKNDQQFPEVWRTTFDETDVTVNVTKFNQKEASGTSLEVKVEEDEARNLFNVLKIICREQKYDEDHARVWEKAFQGLSRCFTHQNRSFLRFRGTHLYDRSVMQHIR